MSLSFDGTAIPGTHGPVVEGPRELHTRRHFFWGVHGEIEIAGGVSGRTLSCQITLHNKWQQYATLQTELTRLEDATLTNGTIEVSGENRYAASYPESTLEVVEWIALPGQNQPGPLVDVSGTLEDDATIGWFLHINLRWRQLVPPAEAQE